MKRVIIESPFNADTQEGIAANLKYARECASDCVRRGEVPFASHLFFPQFLNDKVPEERKLGIEMGFDFWEKADKVLFYVDRGMSPGMKEALAKAVMEDKPFEKRRLPPVKRDPVDLDRLKADMAIPGAKHASQLD